MNIPAMYGKEVWEGDAKAEIERMERDLQRDRATRRAVTIHKDGKRIGDLKFRVPRDQYQVLCDENATLKGAMAAQDERERVAATRLGMIHNCDWPEDVADEVDALKAALVEAQNTIQRMSQPLVAFVSKPMPAMRRERRKIMAFYGQHNLSTRDGCFEAFLQESNRAEELELKCLRLEQILSDLQSKAEEPAEMQEVQMAQENLESITCRHCGSVDGLNPDAQ